MAIKQKIKEALIDLGVYLQDNSEEALQSHLRDMDGKIGKHWFILEKPTFEDQVMIYMRELAYGGKK
ncbi:MAG: hypothetical protein KKB39_01150 [Nanoarchaeota archaeon]|nr:hypothetical protein [Nanoarchaeota archaeon]